MTERMAAANSAEKRTKLNEAERDLLSVERADEWRSMQYGVLANMRAKSQYNDDSYVYKFNDSIDDALESYLDAQGVAEDSPKRDELRRVYRGISIDRISNLEWYASPSSRGETDVEPDKDSSRRDQFIELTRSFNQAETSSTSQDDEADQPETVIDSRELSDDQLERSLEEARDKWASFSAKRQGRARNQVIHGYNQARHDYNQLAREKARRDNLELINDPAASSTDKNAAVTLSMLEEDRQLRQLTTDKLQGTKVSKFINWMNKGGTVRRVGKGILLGAGVGVLGSVLAGAAGASLLAGGAIAGTTAATKAFRGYAAVDRDKRGMASSLESQQQATIDEYAANLPSDSGAIDKVHDRLNAMFEDGSQLEQNKRRRAIAWGVGSMAVGATLGYLMHAGFETLSERNWQLFKDKADSFSSAKPSEVPEIPDLDGNSGNPNQDGLTQLDDNSHHQPNQPNGAGENPIPSDNKTDKEPKLKGIEAEFRVESGHGYSHELMDAAQASGGEISPEQAWAAHQQIVDQVGPDYIDLVDKNGADTYSISSDRYDVGISQPAQATWSPEAAPLIADAIDDGEINSSLDNVSSTDHVVDQMSASDPQLDNSSQLSGIEAAHNDGSNLADLRRNVNTINQLVDANQFEKLNADNSLQDALSYLHADLADVYYPDSTTPIVERSPYDGRWVFNSVPQDSYLPDSVSQTLQSYQSKVYGLAA